MERGPIQSLGHFEFRLKIFDPGHENSDLSLQDFDLPDFNDPDPEKAVNELQTSLAAAFGRDSVAQ